MGRTIFGPTAFALRTCNDQLTGILKVTAVSLFFS